MNSKQRAYLKKLANTLEPIFQVGKGGASPELTEGINEALEKRELIKVTVLKNCIYEVKDIAEMISERTHAQVVQVIGRKFVLYRPSKDEPKIVLPK
ncbi:50S RNA-binding protein [Petrocella atlantisensis]|uniref:50S RNA-binding protein n=1 Tax=Petrocella atlantisensis TaxID=2173034 RepID=A0A3P7RZ82_9FIRM|nr:ribosome assembly RNA-binding protein YhbY [Petrocella atlantisensis]MCF8020789.1 ribosome assembly RNA-binding protein YhbY [Vallitaleaceae bacterium]PKM53279.1 MAG: ribosome assembly RNA-binding protein YhbY [Firmicutes bacterium HGW-Firmicutes-5]VDN46009.1 50S RNA-binding protein [Petrocella atlantisensis]